MQSKWIRRYLDMANLVASWSKDPSTKVGAVLVSPENRVISVGYNGFAKGHDDIKYQTENREYKYSHTVHAEINALLQAGRPVDGCTLFLTPLPPCTHCLAMIKQAGIKAFYFELETTDPERLKRWNLKESLELADSLGIEWYMYHGDKEHNEYTTK